MVPANRLYIETDDGNIQKEKTSPSHQSCSVTDCHHGLWSSLLINWGFQSPAHTQIKHSIDNLNFKQKLWVKSRLWWNVQPLTVLRQVGQCDYDKQTPQRRTGQRGETSSHKPTSSIRWMWTNPVFVTEIFNVSPDPLLFTCSHIL